MNIPLKMNRDFEKAMTTLNERYGEDFEYLNGQECRRRDHRCQCERIQQGYSQSFE